MMSKIQTWLLVLIPGIFFWLGWTPISLFFLLFFAFIPLFELEKRLQNKKRIIYFLYLYIALLFWNILTTWWVWNSSIWGAVSMLILNSLFMCIPWFLYRYFHKRNGESSVYLFVIFWLLYEYIHHRWDASWPWLTLGNSLADTPWLIQWYDITGTLAGSAFIIAMNFLIWKAITLGKKFYIIAAPSLFLFVVLSSFFNVWKWNRSYAIPTSRISVAVLQPNFDPWKEKFNRDPADLLREMIDLSSKAVDSTTDVLVWPETSLVGGIDVDAMKSDALLQALRNFRASFPNLNILTGADMQKIYRNCTKRPTGSARKTGSPDVYWDSYNSAIYLNKNENLQYYHKSKLVPGTEQMPFVQYFPFIDKLAVSLDENSISGSLGHSDSAIAFGIPPLKIAPVICYESIYGDYVSDYIHNGAQAIAVITNDAWWGNTPGYKQHLAYSRLRAIEQRKWVIRSANTGISCFIDPTGKMVKSTNWWEKTTIKNLVELNNYKTLYARFGDVYTLVLLIIICLVLYWKSPK